MNGSFDTYDGYDDYDDDDRDGDPAEHADHHQDDDDHGHDDGLDPIERIFSHLMRVSSAEGRAMDDDTREFLNNNWALAQEKVLSRTKKLRLEPQQEDAPFFFRFELDVPFKRKRKLSDPVELVDGPIRGTVHYRPDVFAIRENELAVAVAIDRELGFFHPNYSRQLGLLCYGDLPGRVEFDAFLEHLYAILTYQNWSTVSPADYDAAMYFTRAPDAMDGLERVEPLWEDEAPRREGEAPSEPGNH